MLKSSSTVESQLRLAGHRPSGFDYLRFMLAISVVVYHSVITSYGPAVQNSLAETALRPFISSILPMFFALSGFLVAGSLERSKTIGSFIGLRAIRIFPALCVETLLSALIIGPAITIYSLTQYYTDPLFSRYFLNILGEPQFYLPGAFAGQPTEKVNGQLWTVPWELSCYYVLALLSLLGVMRRRSLVVISIVCVLCLDSISGGQIDPTHPVAENGILSGYVLLASFLSGVAMFLYRNEIPISNSYGFTSIFITFILLAFQYSVSFLAISFAYITVWIGLKNFRRIRLLDGADYSYGVFLYGYVIQQSYSHFFPDYRIWWLNCLVCVPVSIFVASLSWKFVETPALNLKKQVLGVESAYLRRKALRTGPC